MILLSKEQEIATLSDRHIAVNANAGSGKTTVLVERFLRIIEKEYEKSAKDFDISRIVAITFTRKAAAEMKSSLISKVKDIIDNYDKNNKFDVYFYKRLREKLLYANINTIHSFCLNLLKEYPIEAEIEPNISELTNYDKQQILSASISSVINNWYEQKTEKLNKVIDVFGIKELVNNILPSMINEHEKIKNVADIVHDPKKIIANCNKHLIELIDNLKSDVIGDIEDGLGTIDIKNQNVQEKVSIANNLINELKSENDFFALDQKLTELKKIRFGRSTINSIARNSSPLYKKNIEKFDNVLKLALSDDNSAEITEISRLLLEIYWQIYDEIKIRKTELNAIDFNDMIEKTLNILSTKKVLDSVRGSIDYLMVDEFQDTNQIQYDIVEKIVNGLKTKVFIDDEKNSKHWTNLFIVGDKKQSIYSFRSADVSVYENAIQVIKEVNKNGLEKIKSNANHQSNNLTENEELGEIKFKASHRMQPNLAAFINDLCSSAMKTERSINNDNSFIEQLQRFSVDYDELIAAKNAENALKKLEKEQSLDDKFGRIDLIPRIIGKDEDEDEIRTEAENVAEYISNAFNDENYLIKGDRAKFSDFTVLSRRAKNFGGLASVFTKKNIPFVIHSGKGFFQKQEVMDFINMIKFIINKNNDIALTSVLRSPFFRINDDQLLEISVENGTTFWEKFITYAKNSSNDLTERVISIVESLDSIIYKVTISEFIYRIAENTGWYGTVMNYYDADQRKANLDKLIDYATNFEEQGFKNINDFIDEIELESESDNESEASLSGSGNAVQVMTIHKSKGLGFNVVILFDINSQNNSSPGFYINENYGFAFKTNEANDFLQKNENKPYFLSKYLKDNQEAEEEKRILYVALTRAKEHIAIMANLGTNDNPRGLLKLIFENCDIQREILESNEVVSKISKLSFTKSNKIIEKRLNYRINILKFDDTDIELNTQSNELNTNDALFFNLNEIEPEIHGENYSATKISLFKQNTTKYVNKYLLGIEDDSGIFYEEKIEQENENELDVLDAAIYGTVLHETMEKMSDWINGNGSINNDNLQHTIKKNLKKNGTLIEDITGILDEIKDVINSELIKQNLPNLLESEKELSLMLPFSSEMLYAQIDLLFRNDEGDYEVWDWKTNSINIDEIEKTAKKYETQMKFYAYFVMKKYPEQKSFKTKLLFTKLSEHKKWTYSMVWNKTELIEFGEQLELDVSKIRQHDFADLLY